MSQDYLYAQEKFYTAVSGMAKSSASLRTRIFNAYLSFHVLRPDEMPEDLREDYKWIMDQLTKSEAEGDEGKVQASLKKMDDETAQIIAEKIVYINDHLYAN